MDPIRRFHECPLGVPNHADDLCPLHKRLDEGARMLEKFFADTMVADMLNVPIERKPLCRFPAKKTPD